MKARLYDKNIKPRGTIRFDEDYKRIELQFSRGSNLNQKFKLVVNKFLKDNCLKIVSGEASSNAHNRTFRYKKKIKGFDIFIKYRNPRTQKIELKHITQTPNSASQVSKADEHNISYTQSCYAGLKPHEPKKMKKRYFKTRKEAMNNRQSNERLYFDAHKMEYYLVKFRRRNFWGIK